MYSVEVTLGFELLLTSLPFQLVRLLLRCGAGVDVVNRRGKTPRDVCRSPGIVALIEAASRGLIQELGSSSGDELPQPYIGMCSSLVTLLFYISCMVIFNLYYNHWTGCCAASLSSTGRLGKYAYHYVYYFTKEHVCEDSFYFYVIS